MWMDDGESRARPGSSVLVVVLVSRPAGAGRVPCRADRGAKQDFFFVTGVGTKSIIILTLRLVLQPLVNNSK